MTARGVAQDGGHQGGAHRLPSASRRSALTCSSSATTARDETPDDGAAPRRRMAITHPAGSKPQPER